MKQTRKAKGTANQAVSAEQAIDTAQKQEDQPRITAGFAYITLKKANEMFRATLPTKQQVRDEGRNEFVDLFLGATEVLGGSTEKSFTFNDLAMLLQPYAPDPSSLKTIFSSWISFLESIGKIEKLLGCYDEYVYTLR
jgi:hypothetical protein